MTTSRVLRYFIAAVSLLVIVTVTWTAVLQALTAT